MRISSVLSRIIWLGSRYICDHNLIYFFDLNRAKQEGMVLGDMHLKPGEAWEYCPREALRRVSKILKDEFNLVSMMVYSYEICCHSIANCIYIQVMYAGFESEFYLLKSALRYVMQLFPGLLLILFSSRYCKY